MSKTSLSRTYRCWNDCKMEGCPSHEATLTFQSLTDSFVFEDGKGQKLYAQTPEMGALLEMLYRLSKSRVEVSSMIKEATDEQ